ncbi:hypothetical protein HOO65_080085 [Ceratocystis lukuohia]|uniref:Uncharacterized protein n=1 Tax=Ceratocystis lukuohia TaxID=2019550 RepID=A0ABR4MA46_9PEZI
MQPSSWLPFCLSFSCFQGGNKPGSTDKAQSTSTVDLSSTDIAGALMSMDSWDPGYFTEHGYSVWTEDSVFRVLSQHSDHNSLNLVVHLYVDTEHKAVTIYENNLPNESPSEDALEIQNIYRALCLRAKIDPNRIQWIAMDVSDWTTSIMLEEYRHNNGLGQDDFYITPGQADWERFSTDPHFQAAAKMIPKVEIDRIAVRSQQREAQVSGYLPFDVESMMFSFKQPVSEDDDASIDPIDQSLLEIKIKNNLDAIVHYAEHAIATTTKAFLEAESKSDEAVTEA